MGVQTPTEIEELRHLCESKATATLFFYSQAKRQQQVRQDEIGICKFIFTIIYKALHSFTSLLRTVYTTSTFNHYSKDCKTNNYKKC
ncbi:hypothetical protein [Lysinibacillus sp. NPDC056185]|uniref:hypothetical protein n=1 Tax=Lysinibacillus sp. NPDC056185 TaxID=3345739 RepID=UPI0039F0F54E